MSANSTLTINSGGVFRLVGTDESNLATLTRQSAGTYSANVNSGATVHAKFYLMEYMNASGFVVNTGATVNATNDFSDGTFSNGASGGVFLNIAGEFSDAINHTLYNVTFNSGAADNVRRLTGTAIVTFEDASGTLAGAAFEDDDGSASTGLIRWTYTGTLLTWDGSVSSDWNDDANWTGGAAPTTDNYPVTYDELIITIPAGAIPNNPTIDGSGGYSPAGKDITIGTGRTLTFTNGGTLEVTNDLLNSGTIVAGSSTITINNAFTNSGTFTSGTSTVVLTAATGTKTITEGTATFYNLTISGAATFNLSSTLDITNNLTVSAGVLDITGSNFAVNVSGNLSFAGGGFTQRTGTVTMSSTGSRTLNAGTINFYNLVINKTGGGSVALSTNPLTVTNNLTLTAGTFNSSNLAIEVRGNWTNSAATFTAGTGTVTFAGSGNSNVTSNSQSFYHVVVNKGTNSNQVSLSSNMTIGGDLTVTRGILFANGRILSAGTNNSVALNGTISVDAGAQLQLSGTSGHAVSGALRLVGTNASSRALLTKKSAGTNFQVTISGTLFARFATIDQTGGNGIVMASGSTIDVTDNLNTVRFQNGSGNAFITLNSDQSVTLDNVEFVGGTVPTNNASSTAGSGSFIFNNYTGTFSGARFESDPGTIPQGRIRWIFDQTITSLSNGNTYTFGNDFIVSVTSGSLTSLRVVLTDDWLDPQYNQTIRRYYTVTPIGGPYTVNVTQHWGANDQNGQIADGTLNFWNRNGGIFTQLGTNAVDGSVGVKSATKNAITELTGDWFLSNALTESALPVEMGLVEVTSSRKGVLIKWETETETNNALWKIKRAQVSSADSMNFSIVGELNGKGSSVNPTKYQFLDANVIAGNIYKYRLISIDYDGTEYVHELNTILVETPSSFALGQNYPNPFNPSTTIPFDVAFDQNVSLIVYNMLGQEVKVLVNEVLKAGYYDHIKWDGKDQYGNTVSSGQYFVRMVSDGFVKTQKLILLK